MKKENLILEPSFNLQQQIIILGISLIPLMFIIALIEAKLNWKGYLTFTFVLLLFSYLFALAFSKKGMIKKGNKLYKAKFFRGHTLFRQKVDLSDRPVVSILKFKKSQKLAFFSAARPDLSESFNSFEIFVLNENHFKRDSVMYFEEEDSAKKAVEFLTTDFPLRHEVFSPNLAR
ncbi:hypothetical protein [Salegentibacter chungangensis]|uniref:Uncharacterized protein n=1 Tax=Salegentibacter chungangensis TaxID=1335724 RepID=A0ABW3NRT1_9FLAO